MLQKVLLWSKDEQKRLEAALQMYTKSTLGDRWAKISSHVGKSKVNRQIMIYSIKKNLINNEK
jgi:hypothetical protein